LETTKANKNGAPANGHRLAFDTFEVDPTNRILFRSGVEVAVTGKAFDVLLALAENPGRLLEKEELIELVWRSDFVEEGNLAKAVSTLRRSLNDTGKKHKYIATVQGRGYRFVAEVKILSPIPARIETSGLPPDEHEIPEYSLVDDYSAKINQKKGMLQTYLAAAGGVFAAILIALLILENRPASPSSDKPVRIAVLPFNTLNGGNTDPLYELGMPDSIISRLNGLKGLIVRPLTATRNYNDATQDAVVIGKEQQVDYVVASNYQIANGRIRITSQITNVANAEVEDSFADEEGQSNIFAAQNAVAEKFAGKFLAKFRLEPPRWPPSHHTENEDAYRLYLEGMNLADQRGGPNSRRAVELFEEAVKLDPNYAQAYAGLAFAHRTVSIFGGHQHEEYAKSRQAVQRALGLDNNLSSAHTILGEIEFSYEWNFPEAEKELRLGIALDPTSGFAHRFYAIFLSNMRRFDEALFEIKTAIDLDPNSNFNQRIFGFTLYFARRYDEAITQLKRAAEMAPDKVANYGWLSLAYDQSGDYAHAFEYFLLSAAKQGATVEELTGWKNTYSKSGWHGVLRRKFDQEKKAGDSDAELAAELGEKEEAFAELEKEYEARDGSLLWLQSNPQLDSLRSDPRLDELAAKIGLK